MAIIFFKNPVLLSEKKPTVSELLIIVVNCREVKKKKFPCNL